MVNDNWYIFTNVSLPFFAQTKWNILHTHYADRNELQIYIYLSSTEFEVEAIGLPCDTCTHYNVNDDSAKILVILYSKGLASW